MCAFKIKASAGDFVPGSKVKGKFKAFKPTRNHHEKAVNYHWDNQTMNHAIRVESAQATGMGIKSFMKTGKLKKTQMAGGLTGWKKSNALSKNQKLGLKKYWGY